MSKKKIKKTRSEAHKYMGLPGHLRIIIRWIVYDQERRRKILADPGASADLRAKSEKIDKKLRKASERLDEELREVFLDDIAAGRGFETSIAHNFMSRPTYYRQKNKLEREIARQFGFI